MPQSHTTREQKARITSCAARSASLFLTTPPSHSMHEIPSAQFILAIKHRLDLPPTFNQQCACKADLATTPSHFHLCTLLRRKAIILNTLATLTRQAGCDIRGALTYTHNNANTHHLRPDALAITSDGPVLVDVSVTHPLVSSYVRAASKTPLAAAKQVERERMKVSQYQELARRESATFVPFVLESYGGIGPLAAALRFLRSIAAEATSNHTSPDADSFYTFALASVSAALQKGNAILAQRHGDGLAAPRARVHAAWSDSAEQWVHEHEDTVLSAARNLTI